jgi:chromosome partitioning protein
MIILVCSTKGGVGKSTIATNLAATAALNGLDVVLLDTDSQCTSATWATDREQTDAPQVPCVQRVGNVTATAKELDNKYDLVIIDAGGHDSTGLRTGLLAADIVVTPFKPSQADLDTVYQLNDVISQAKDFNSKLQVLGLLTMCPTHHANTEIQQAREYLSEHINVLDCVVYDRKAYRDALSMGLSVTEYSDKKAKQEIKALTKALTNG